MATAPTLDLSNYRPTLGETTTFVTKMANMQTDLESFATALNQFATEMNQDLSAANQAKQFAEAAKGIAEQAKKDAQAIAESGLPSQTGNKNKVFTTDGTNGSWQFPNTINRYETDDFTLEAGDHVHCTAETEIIDITIPALNGGEPFVIKNSANSGFAVRLFNPTLTIISPNKFTYNPGDNILIEPGEEISIVINKTDTTKAERLS